MFYVNYLFLLSIQFFPLGQTSQLHTILFVFFLNDLNIMSSCLPSLRFAMESLLTGGIQNRAGHTVCTSMNPFHRRTMVVYSSEELFLRLSPSFHILSLVHLSAVLIPFFPDSVEDGIPSSWKLGVAMLLVLVRELYMEALNRICMWPL